MFDEEGRKIKINEFPRNFDGMSVAELEAYIIDLNAEIMRVNTEIGRKKASAEAASAFFKSD